MIAMALCSLVLLLPASIAWAEAGLAVAAGSDATLTDSVSGSMAVEGDAVEDGIGDAASQGAIGPRTLSESRANGTFYASMNGGLWQTEAYRMLAMVNAERARVGVPALQWDYDLEQSAIQRSAEIFLMFSHDRPDGSSCFSAFPSGLSMYGENIAMASFGNADNAFNMV